MSARSLRGLFDFIVGAGADPPLVQPLLNADAVGFNYQMADIEQTLNARRGIRMIARCISSALAAQNSSVELQTFNQGAWIRRMRQTAGSNWQWTLGLNIGGSTLNTTDAEPLVQTMFSNEGSVFATSILLLSTQLPNRVAFRTGRKLVLGSGIFQTSGEDPFHELSPIWMPPNSMLVIDMITQNVAASVAFDIELPVRGADVNA